MQQLVAQLPWGHNIRLVEAFKQPEERAWYASQAVEHGWSRAVLAHQIEGRLIDCVGKAPTNFAQTLLYSATPSRRLGRIDFSQIQNAALNDAATVQALIFDHTPIGVGLAILLSLGLALYSASKAAAISLVRSAAMEYAEKGVRINAVAPGRVVTDMMLASGIMDMNAVAAGLPLRRMGRPEEVAEAVVWLASDAASFVVGHVLCTDGGFMTL